MALGTVTPGALHPFENKEVLIGPDGTVIYSYLKNRPVAGWEASVMRTGDGRVAMADTTIGRISSAICFDNDAPEFVRQIGSGRADLWILPANEWEAVGELHFEMAAFRAVENGTPILRAAATGISGVFDAWGRVLAATDHLAGAPTMAASLPLGGVPTVYARIGDFFAWACVLGSVDDGRIRMARARRRPCGVPHPLRVPEPRTRRERQGPPGASQLRHDARGQKKGQARVLEWPL
jgi:apolipoprotein N-acyltransferase